MRFGVIIILVYIALAFIVDGGIWLLCPKARRRKWRWPYLGFTILCWGLLIVAVSLPWRNVSSSLVPKMWMLYTWLSIYVVKGSVLSWQLVGLIPRLWKDRRMQLGLYVGLPVGLVCFGLMWWGALAGRRQIEMVRVDVASPRLPQTFEGFTIAQISDLHLGTWGNDTSFISALVDSVNAQRPDLIAFTGDLVNRSSSETAPFVRILSRLHAPCGVISVMGNHDYGDYANWTTEQAHHADVDRLRATQRSMGWLLLDNAYTSLVRGSDTIYIIGVENWGEPPFSSYGDLAAALSTHVRPGDDTRLPAKGSAYKLLLSHNPEHWRLRVRHESDIDLTLSGHTHAMQFAVGSRSRRFSPAVWRYPAWGGLYTTASADADALPVRSYTAGNSSQLYVNIGAGEVGLPFRIGAAPEITLITLTRTGGTAPHPLP